MLTVAAHCPKCEEELAVGLPMRASVFTDTLRSFDEEHRRVCRAVPLAGPGNRKDDKQKPTEEQPLGVVYFDQIADRYVAVGGGIEITAPMLMKYKHKISGTRGWIDFSDTK